MGGKPPYTEIKSCIINNKGGIPMRYKRVTVIFLSILLVLINVFPSQAMTYADEKIATKKTTSEVVGETENKSFNFSKGTMTPGGDGRSGYVLRSKYRQYGILGYAGTTYYYNIVYVDKKFYFVIVKNAKMTDVFAEFNLPVKFGDSNTFIMDITNKMESFSSFDYDTNRFYYTGIDSSLIPPKNTIGDSGHEAAKFYYSDFSFNPVGVAGALAELGKYGSYDSNLLDTTEKLLQASYTFSGVKNFNQNETTGTILSNANGTQGGADLRFEISDISNLDTSNLYDGNGNIRYDELLGQYINYYAGGNDVTPLIKTILKKKKDIEKDKTKYPALYEIVKASDKILEICNIQEVKQNQQSTAQAVANSIQDYTDNPDTFPCVKKWEAVIQNYILTGKTSLTFEEEYDLLSYQTSCKWNGSNGDPDPDNPNEPFGVTQEEDARLRAYAILLIGHMTPIDGVTYKNDEVLAQFTWDYLINKNETLPVNKDGYTADAVVAGANNAVIDASGNSTSSTTVTKESVSTNFYNIARYQLGKIYGNTPDPDPNGQTGTSVTEMNYSAYLEGITATDEAAINSVMSTSGYIPMIGELLQIHAIPEAFNAYKDMYLNLILVATYAEDRVKEDNGNYTYPDFESLVTNSTGNEASANIQDVNLAAWIKAVEQVHDGLDYLGIDPWTPELEYMYGCYGKAIKFKENPTLDTYDPASLLEEPFANFFSLKDSKFAENYSLGVALSSTYIPMQTSLFDPNSLRCLPAGKVDTFVPDFHYKYGFYRKALMIDTNVNAAVDTYVTGKKGILRHASLNDMLNAEKDIVLYVDTNFYNQDIIETLQNSMIEKYVEEQEKREEWKWDLEKGVSQNVTSGLENKGLEYVEQKKEELGEVVADKLGQSVENSMKSLVKSDGIYAYNDKIAENTNKYNEKIGLKNIKKYDDTVFSSENIQDYLAMDEYSPLQAFAVVSAIYRDKELYNLVKGEAAAYSPVFVSSRNLPAVTGITEKEWNSIYNYLQLKNIKRNMGIDYKTALDLDSPLYIDIYGNISTESGLVVIPAASNATLHQADMYDLLTVGFIQLYNTSNSDKLPADFKNSSEFLGKDDKWEIDEEIQCWQMNNATIEFNGQRGISLNLMDMPIANDDVLSTFFENYSYQIKHSNLNWGQHVFLITEVLRGAPIENIDKEKEGIKISFNLNKYGIYYAYKLEELANQFMSNTNGNSVITLPNIYFMEGIEYIVLYGFKIMLIFGIWAASVKLYMDAMRGTLGIKTFGSLLFILLLFSVTVMTCPSLLNISYYNTNKFLLQNEAIYMQLLNTEKKNEGREIGITDVKEPESTTKLYLKFDNVSVKWYSIIDKIMFSNISTSLSELYDKELSGNTFANLPGMIKKANGIYMDVDYLFDTSDIVLIRAPRQVKKEVDEETGEVTETEDNSSNVFYDDYLVNNVKETPYASYGIPYYSILKKLIEDVRIYNRNNQINSYTTKIQAGGKVRTVGVIEPYLTSNYFMNSENSENLTGLYEAYQVEETLVTNYFHFMNSNPQDIQRMRQSFWCNNDNFTEQEQREKLKKLDDDARYFVTQNKILLGKVSDETFLKCMALYLSVRHNDLFKVPCCRGLEIMDVDSKDLIRLSMAPKSTVMENSANSFSRFVYEESGTLGVIAAAVLIMIFWVSSFIKPICLILILASMVASVIIKRLVQRVNNNAIEGYIITMGILCLANIVYAGVLKVSMLLPNMIISGTAALLLQIALQILYLSFMIYITQIVFRDWRNMGFTKYQSAYYAHGEGVVQQANILIDKATVGGRFNPFRHTNRVRNKMLDNRKSPNLTTNVVLEEMNERDERREEDIYG